MKIEIANLLSKTPSTVLNAVKPITTGTTNHTANDLSRLIRVLLLMNRVSVPNAFLNAYAANIGAGRFTTGRDRG